jgi:tRNA (cmo5U34)-methyltransferase
MSPKVGSAGPSSASTGAPGSGSSELDAAGHVTAEDQPLSPTKAGSWTFGGGLARVFDDHVRRSIPGYLTLHELCLQALAREVRPGDVVYDLGCSTGLFTSRLKRTWPNLRVIGVDNEQEMIAEASRRDGEVEFVCHSVAELELEPARAVVALYVLQFLPLAQRLTTLERIRRSLGGSGLLVLAEKVHFLDPGEQARVDSAYRAFKLAQGFSEAEVDAKARALEGVLVPLTASENEALLRAAGFLSIDLLFSELGFRAWVAR